MILGICGVTFTLAGVMFLAFRWHFRFKLPTYQHEVVLESGRKLDTDVYLRYDAWRRYGRSDYILFHYIDNQLVAINLADSELLDLETFYVNKDDSDGSVLYRHEGSDGSILGVIYVNPDDDPSDPFKP